MGRTLYAVTGGFAMRPADGKCVRIYSYREEDGSLELTCTFPDSWNVGQQVYDPQKQILYIADESLAHDGIPGSGGQIIAVSFSSDGKWTLLNKRPSLGALPSYICIDQKRQQLLVPHHGHATFIPKLQQKADNTYEVCPVQEDVGLILFKLNEDGSIGDAVDAWIPEGQAPHLHNCVISPEGEYAIVCDKGLDKIHIFKLSSGKMQWVRDIDGPKGSSPRYTCFHPEKPILYQNSENLAYINVWSWDAGSAGLDRLQSIALLEDEKEADAWTREGASDLLITHDGKFLYATLRGINVLAVYGIEEDGRLRLIQNITCGGENPRGLALSPDERFLFVMNRDTEEIAAFSIEEDGRLTDTGSRTECPIAANMVFIISNG